MIVELRILLVLATVGFFMLISTSAVSACTYEGTITGSHLDFSITSDTNHIGLLQYIRLSGNAVVTKMYSPTVSDPWTYSDDPNCNVFTTHPLVCRQKRGITLGDGGFWYWSVNGDGNYPNHLLPSGVWGMDFNTTPTYDSLGIEYGSNDGSSQGDFWTLCTRTGDVTLPTPTPTPTPSPTPIPVTKTFLVPGFGASWNASAFASCTFDDNPSHWSLATYAADVYNPLITALSDSGWNTTPFYYDWRQGIPINSNTLGNIINANVLAGEKVNLVGHSMGGLIGRQFLTNSGGVKLNKFLTAGSPHMGVPVAYPAWSGGDIWEDNFVTKTAMTLFLNHCGGLLSNPRVSVQNNFPSIGNLLPIFDYILKNPKQFKSWQSMLTQNTWHPDNNFDTHGVTMETTNGTGFSTLKSILIKQPSKTDIKSGNWLDGKPSGKVYSNDGDGTVLASTSTLPGVTNVSLNETHSGLVNSISGMAEILRFLGSSPTSLNPPNFSDPKSALIVIGYPSSFWITDQNGNTNKDDHGMVSIINPKSGNFKVNLIPQTGDTLFVVMQVLPNGDTKYKEYNLTGYSPKSKTLKFDLENPQEDILN